MREAIRDLHGRTVMFKRTANLSVADASNTLVPWTASIGDGPIFLSGDGKKMRPALAGWYTFRLQAHWASNATGRREIYLRKNGTSEAFETRAATSGEKTGHPLELTVWLSVTDDMEVMVFQNSTVALDFELTSKIEVTYEGAG
jgi:hypothetical protein